MENNADNDLKIIQAVLNGRTEAYAELVDAYQDKVYSLCLSLLKNPAEAEDAAQEIFLRAFKNLLRFRLKSSFSTWLYQITANFCLDALKKIERKRVVSIESIRNEDGDFPNNTSRQDNLHPDEETQTMIKTVLGGLSPAYRLILTLREVQGLSYQAISEVTQTSIDSVKARIKRAREALQKKARHFLTHLTSK